MFLEEMGLTENYSSHKIKFNQTALQKVEVSEVIEEVDKASKGNKFKGVKMYCSALPTALAMIPFLVSARTTYGLWEVAEPVILPLVFDTGRIVFYLNASSCVYKMCNSDSKGAIKQFKNVSLGYALLLSIDTIMYFIEFYVDGIKDTALTTMGMGVLGL